MSASLIPRPREPLGPCQVRPVARVHQHPGLSPAITTMFELGNGRSTNRSQRGEPTRPTPRAASDKLTVVRSTTYVMGVGFPHQRSYANRIWARRTGVAR